MALIICAECGKEFSDKAGACPNCGCPVETTKDFAEPKKKKGFFKKLMDEAENYGGLTCPKCRGHNIDLWSNTANMKIKQKTSLDLNPLHPFTLVNTKEVKKEKRSAAKVGLAIMTGGTSALITGTKKKKHNEYYCRDCGNRWVGR